jgi:hypothetical protein
LKIRFMTKDDANNHMVAEVAYLLSHLWSCGDSLLHF